MNIIIFTPLILERQATLAHLEDVKEQLLDGRLYFSGTFTGKFQKFEVTIVVTGSSSSLVSSTVERSITQFHPQMVFLLGIAGGVKDVKIGDVVVGTKAYGYESGKEKADGFKVRPQVFSASQDLISLAELVAHQRTWWNRSSTHTSAPTVVFGPIASGDKVIATTQSTVYQLLKKSYNDTIALEMEAAAFGQTLHNRQNVRWINIRGISDLLEGKNAVDDVDHQPLAASSAASFTFEMLYQFDPSHFNLPIMDIKTLTGFLVTALGPFLKKSKSVDTISKDIAEASDTTLSNIWKKISPVFIEEFEEETGQLSEEAQEEAAVTHVLKKKLKKDEALKNTLEALLKERATHQPTSSTVIKHSKNVISGSSISVGGDFRLGDGN